MRRRDFVTLLGSAAATWPLAARAQRQGPTLPRLGMILPALAAGEREAIAGGVQRLAELGWNDGRNLRLDQVWLSGMDLDVVRARASELIARVPDVIWLLSNPVMAVLQRTTRTIPIVFVQVADPVGSGFVESLARPGGNVTGFTNFEDSMGGKWLDILKELAPQTTRALVMFHQETAAHRAFLRTMEAAAATLNVALTPAAIHDASDIARGITAFAGEPSGGLIPLPHPLTVENGSMIAALAALHRLPAVYAFRYFAAAGGLLSYGSDPADLWRRSASYVDRILHGAKPSDLPVQAPTKFQLVINLQTAKALGLEVPAQLLARADEVIE
jgi:putative tryptophan/tyrosine transport system substrate-binding protein